MEDGYQDSIIAEDGTIFIPVREYGVYGGHLQEIVRRSPEGNILQTYPVYGESRLHFNGGLSITNGYLYYAGDGESWNLVSGRIPINGQNTAQIAELDIETSVSTWRSAE